MTAAAAVDQVVATLLLEAATSLVVVASFPPTAVEAVVVAPAVVCAVAGTLALALGLPFNATAGHAHRQSAVKNGAITLRK